MTEADALALLMSYQRPELKLAESPDESAAARNLAVELLGGLPLAIAQAGFCIFNNGYKYSEYCKEFEKSPQTSLSYEIQPQQWSPRCKPVWKTFTTSIGQIQHLNERAPVWQLNCCAL
ncbi:PFS domain-containing protein [Colletotrichum tofieldiae]|nr:PFS domain-containing protein [Colletotrichum tofieldiae]